MSQLNLKSPSVNLDEAIYQWLDDHTRMMIELDPEKSPGTYTLSLKKIFTEGLENLSKIHPDNPVLFSFLERLVAEALLDLALVEKETGARNVYLKESHQGCLRVMTVLKDNNIPGLTSTILPRVIAILGYAIQCTGSTKNTLRKTL